MSIYSMSSKFISQITSIKGYYFQIDQIDAICYDKLVALGKEALGGNLSILRYELW